MLHSPFLQCHYDNQPLDEVQARTKTKQSCGELRVLEKQHQIQLLWHVGSTNMKAAHLFM